MRETLATVEGDGYTITVTAEVEAERGGPGPSAVGRAVAKVGKLKPAVRAAVGATNVR